MDSLKRENENLKAEIKRLRKYRIPSKANKIDINTSIYDQVPTKDPGFAYDDY